MLGRTCCFWELRDSLLQSIQNLFGKGLNSELYITNVKKIGQPYPSKGSLGTSLSSQSQTMNQTTFSL